MTGQTMPIHVNRDADSLRKKVLVASGGEEAGWVAPEHPPILGPGFSDELRRLAAHRQEHVAEILNWLNALPDDELLSSFNTYGDAVGAEAKIWQLEIQSRIPKESAEGLQEIAAGLGMPGLMPEHAYWSMAAFFSLEEAAMLSCGLEPAPSFEGLKFNVLAPESSASSAELFAKKRYDLIRREFDPDGNDGRVAPAKLFDKLFDWIRSSGLEVHPGFMAMLKDRAARDLLPNDTLNTTALPLPTDTKSTKFDAREVKSITMLLAAITIDSYGFDPQANKSPIPKEIEGIAARLGLELTPETIRKYLKMGASFLPIDWKQEVK